LPDFANASPDGDKQSQLLPKKVEALAGQHVVAVSAGAYHSIALTANGAVWSWGEGWDGRLGHGDNQQELLPKKIDAFAGQRVVAVSAGAHSLVLTADGAVWSWGYGYSGQLGHGDHQNQLLPKKIEAFAGRRVVAVAAQLLLAQLVVVPLEEGACPLLALLALLLALERGPLLERHPRLRLLSADLG